MRRRPAFPPLFAVFLFIATCSLAQVTQTVRGRVTDHATGAGIPGAVVQVVDVPSLNATTGADGSYRLPGVPVGRHSFRIFYLGYKPSMATDMIVSSGKELVVNAEMEESLVGMEEVQVTARNDSDLVTSMTTANMKPFSIEETERYPGSRLDPARMAQNFAGVQGTNDSRNDIVVRGNSPAGLLWRFDDIDIPNPNHFAVAGSMGGPQSIINNKYLANSEFYTGAFPASYGNALGGVFDLRVRNGNNEKHERTLQLGVLGTEAAVEGPIGKNGASYLATYRYSTLALFGAVNFNLGTSAIPRYQDGGLRINVPTKKAGVFSFSGIGGLSAISIILSKTSERPRELYGDQNRDQYFTSNMGVGILSHVYQFSTRTVMKTSLAYAAQTVSSSHYLVLRNKDFVPNDTVPQMLGYDFYENKGTLAWYVRHKMNARNSIKAGFFANRFDVSYHDKIKINSLYDTLALPIQRKPFKVRESANDNYYLLQPYVSYVRQFTEALSVNAGVFSQLLTLNNRFSVEPRVSARYQPTHRQVFSLSYGLHSQMQAPYLYYAIPDSVISNGAVVANSKRELTNLDLDFSRSHHFVAGYDYFATRYLRLRTEVYYQYLWSVPVYVVPSGVSAINRGATFNRFYPVYTMVNKGTGYNYGIELTVERRYYRNYYVLFSGSLYQSKYRGSDGVIANTDFNGNYMFNLLSGYEFRLAGKDVLSVGGKFTYGGGKRYSPADVAASNAIMDVVPQQGRINSLQFAPYSRLDLRVSYRINGRHVGTEIALDLINIMNTRNVLALSYAPDPANLNANPLVKNYQLGFLPLFYVRFDF